MLAAWLAAEGTVDRLLGPTAVFPRSSLHYLLSERRRRADGSVLPHPLDGPAEPFSTSSTKKTFRRREPPTAHHPRRSSKNRRTASSSVRPIARSKAPRAWGLSPRRSRRWARTAQ